MKTNNKTSKKLAESEGFLGFNLSDDDIQSFIELMERRQAREHEKL
jgi:hypothetical protein